MATTIPTQTALVPWVATVDTTAGVSHIVSGAYALGWDLKGGMPQCRFPSNSILTRRCHCRNSWPATCERQSRLDGSIPGVACQVRERSATNCAFPETPSLLPMIALRPRATSLRARGQARSSATGRWLPAPAQVAGCRRWPKRAPPDRAGWGGVRRDCDGGPTGFQL